MAHTLRLHLDEYTNRVLVEGRADGVPVASPQEDIGDINGDEPDGRGGHEAATQELDVQALLPFHLTGECAIVEREGNGGVPLRVAAMALVHGRRHSQTRVHPRHRVRCHATDAHFL